MDKFTIQLDIWGNISKVSFYNGETHEQLFIDSLLVSYKNSYGDSWRLMGNKKIGKCPYLIYKLNTGTAFLMGKVNHRCVLKPPVYNQHEIIISLITYNDYKFSALWGSPISTMSRAVGIPATRLCYNPHSDSITALAMAIYTTNNYIDKKFKRKFG